ncbi:MAG: hypothetical protein V3T77_05070, partial [Planctomycetota bacterium]
MNRSRGLLGALFIAVLVVSLTDPLEAQRSYPRGTRVEVDGIYKDGYLQAIKVVVEEPDAWPEIKGRPIRIDLGANIIEIPPFIIEVTRFTDIEDDALDNKSYLLDELQLDWRLEVQGELISTHRVRAEEIEVARYSTKGEVLELEGFVEEERLEPGGVHIIVVLGVPCRITAETEQPQEVFTKGPRRVVDPDRRRPAEQLVLWNRLTLGGEFQVEYEYRDDFDLDKHDNEDFSFIDTAFTLEAELDLGRYGYMFGTVISTKGYIIDDEDRDRDLDERTQIGELYFYWQRPLDLPGTDLQIGRQRFEDKREWIYDEPIDALRLYWQYGALELEYSWSFFISNPPRRLGDGSRPDVDDLYNQILMMRWRQSRDSYIAAYIVD